MVIEMFSMIPLPLCKERNGVCAGYQWKLLSQHASMLEAEKAPLELWSVVFL